MNELIAEPLTNGTGFNLALFETSLRISKVLSRASLLPDHLRIDPKTKAVLPIEQIEANCVLIVNQAFRWGVDPFAIAPESYVVGGKLAYQGKLIAGLINASGKLKERLKPTYTGEGENRVVTLSGFIIGEQEPSTVELEYKKAVTRKDGKITDQWTRDPDQKLFYSAAIKWARRHTPEILLGIVTPEYNVDEDTTDLSSPDSLVGRITQKPGPRLECNTDNIDTSDLTEILSEQMTQAESYRKRITDAKTRDEVTRLVDRINAEMPAVLSPTDADALKDFARDKYKTIPEGRPEMLSETAIATTEASYRDFLAAAKTRDELVDLLDEINSNEQLPVAVRKRLSAFGNSRTEQVGAT